METELTKLEGEQHTTKGQRGTGREHEEGDLQHLTSFLRQNTLLGEAAVPGKLRLTWQVLQRI